MTATTDMRDQYIAAEAAILSGQHFRFGDRELYKADLAQIQAGRREWERKSVAEARAGNGCGNPDVSLANLSGIAQTLEGGEGNYPWFRG